MWFRDSTRREAVQLGITGYAINLENGDVEVLACGATEALVKLKAWLYEGPPLASVSSVEETRVDFQTLPDFRTG